MPAKNESTANQKDALTLALESNPCAKCRAMGSASCRGHGGGSGGGGEELGSTGSDSSGNSESSPAKTTSVGSNLLVAHLVQEYEGWQEEQSTTIDDRIFTFDSPHAFFKMILNIDKGLFTVSEKEGLSEPQREDVHEYFDALIDELPDLNEFKLLDRELKIKIPQPAYYDLFLDKLLRNNYLPNLYPKPSLQKESTPRIDASADEQDEFSLSTAPTPFSMRPKPPTGYEK